MENIFSGIFALLIGIIGISVGFVQLKNLAALRLWKITDGKVIERGTFRVSYGAPSPPAFRHSPLIKYIYQVNGKEFINDSIFPKHIQLPEHNTIKWAKKRADSFPDNVIVHYNPKNPADSFLVQTSKIKLYIIIGGSLLACLVGLLFLLSAF